MALVVPRSCLEPFTDVSPEMISTPRVYLSVGSNGLFEQHFFGIDCFFGNLKAVHGMVSRCGVEEDRKGWQGCGDLVVTCLCPSWLLLTGPRSNIHVSLKVYKSQTSISRYGAKFGGEMVVFGCGLANKRLWVLDDIPGVLQGRPCLTEIPKLLPLGTQDADIPAVALTNDGTVKHITIKKQFPTQAVESKMLKEGAKLAISQISPCVLQLKIGKVSLKLVYPYPVNGDKSVTQVSRERAFVQVAAPPASARGPGGFKQNPFPVILRGRQPVSWNLPRLVIDQQPQVANPLTFNGVIHASLSSSEDDARYNTLGGAKGAFAAVKQNIIALLTGLTGQHPDSLGDSCTTFGFKQGEMLDMVIFTHAIHHDRDAGSIFLESFVVPINLSRMKLMARHLRQVKDIRWLGIGNLELRLWKQLLPACVERCRETWEHKSTCAYIIKGRIPLSTTLCEPSICTCGEGQDITNFPQNLSGLANFATRIAIPLLSAVPYVDPMPPRPVTKLPNNLASYNPITRCGVQLATPKPGASRCAHCDEVKGNLQLCSGCHKVRYCSKECQKAAWKEHKQNCDKSSGT